MILSLYQLNNNIISSLISETLFPDGSGGAELLSQAPTDSFHDCV